jgi:hypothetical protein
MSSVFKWALVGDLQIPYENKRAVALWFKAMKLWKPDAIDFVGDIDDQLEYSRFSDGTTDEFFNKLKAMERENDKAQVEYEKAVAKADAKVSAGTDLMVAVQVPIKHDINPLPFVKKNAQGAREFYEAVRKQHKNADLHASLGNHDIRVFSYLDKKAPEYLDEVTPEMLWGLDNAGITWRMYDEVPLLRFAGIHVHHGNTTTTTGLAVKTDIENYNISLARGHDHRGGVVFKSYPMTGTTLIGLGTGHMCDPGAYGLRYTTNPSWELGFGLVHVVDGKAIAQFVPIFESDQGLACIIDGKLIVE